MIWEGGSYADYFEQHVRLDRGGRLVLPARRAWRSVFSRFGSVLGSFMPHNGFAPAFARVYFNVPPDYEFDAARSGSNVVTDSGASGAGRIRQWDLSGGDWHVISNEGTGEQGADVLGLDADHPGRWGSSTYRLVLRKKPIQPGQ